MNYAERCERAIKEIESKYSNPELFRSFLCIERNKKRIWRLEYETPLDMWARELVDNIYPHYVGVYVKQADDYDEKIFIGDLVAISLAGESERGTGHIVINEKICKEFVIRGSFWHHLFIKSLGYFYEIDADQALRVLDKILALIEEINKCKEKSKEKWKELDMLAEAETSNKLTEESL